MGTCYAVRDFIDAMPAANSGNVVLHLPHGRDARNLSAVHTPQPVT